MCQHYPGTFQTSASPEYSAVLSWRNAKFRAGAGIVFILVFLSSKHKDRLCFPSLKVRLPDISFMYSLICRIICLWSSMWLLSGPYIQWQWYQYLTKAQTHGLLGREWYPKASNLLNHLWIDESIHKTVVSSFPLFRNDNIVGKRRFNPFQDNKNGSFESSFPIFTAPTLTDSTISKEEMYS